MLALPDPLGSASAFQLVTQIRVGDVSLDLSLAQPMQVVEREKSRIRAHRFGLLSAAPTHFIYHRQQGIVITGLLRNPLPHDYVVLADGTLSRISQHPSFAGAQKPRILIAARQPSQAALAQPLQPLWNLLQATFPLRHLHPHASILVRVVGITGLLPAPYVSPQSGS